MNIDDIKTRWTTEYNIQLSSYAKSCTSHHFACDCREHQRQEDIGELLRTVERLEGALEKIASLPDTWVRATGDYADIARQALKKEA